MGFLHSSMPFKDSRTNWTRNWKKKAIKQFIQYQKRKNWYSNWRYEYVLVKTTLFYFIFCCRPRHVNKCWRRQRPKWRIFVISCRFRMKTIGILKERLAKQNTYGWPRDLSAINMLIWKNKLLISSFCCLKRLLNSSARKRRLKKLGMPWKTCCYILIAMNRYF